MRLLRMVCGPLLLILATACSDNSQPVAHDSEDSKKGSIQTTNAWEWAGQAHNLGVAYLESQFTYASFSPTSWIEQTFIDSIINKSSFWYDSIYVGINSSRPAATANLTSSSLVQAMFQRLINPAGLVDYVGSVVDTLTPNQYMTPKSLGYMDRMVSVCNTYIDNYTTFSITNFIDSVDAIEAEILADVWAPNDHAARISIAIMKHSADYWYSQYPLNPIMMRDSKSDGMVQAPNQYERAAMICTDTVVGLGVFGAASGATGGIGLAAGAWAGVKAGVAASGAVSALGTMFGWW